MTLRRCDSLPTRLRETPLPSPEATQPLNNIPNSITDANSNGYVREEVVATWESLHTDVNNIKNGIPKNENETDKPESNNASKKRSKRISYDNRVVVGSDDDAVPGKNVKKSKKSNSVKRRTLLERLLSWRTPECECHLKCRRKDCVTKTRADEILCTCGVVARSPTKQKFSERARSKSVGYEVPREVTQFRRSASAGATVGAETAAAIRARAALTLARRYYPEGGWGWTITVVSTIVQVLSHGLQLGGGTGAIACTAAVKYHVPPLYTYASTTTRAVTTIGKGHTYRSVKQTLGVPAFVVHRNFQRYRETGSYVRRREQGKYRVGIMVQDDRFVRVQALRNRPQTALQRRNLSEQVRDVRVSNCTVRRRLKEVKLNSKVPASFVRVQALRNRPQTALQRRNLSEQVRDVRVSNCTVRRRLKEVKLNSKVPARAPKLETGQQRASRCLDPGHLASNCQSPVDRSRNCFRCGKPGHKAADCAEKPSCFFCAELGKESNHVLGANGCITAASKPPGTRKKRMAPSKARPRKRPGADKAGASEVAPAMEVEA